MKIYGPQITGSLGINGSTIGNFNNLVSTSSFNQYTSSVTTGSLATTGSNTFVGNQTMSGSIIPAVTNIYDLGDVSHQFRHLYLSSGSLYINGTKVLGATGQELQITTDNGQSLKILEAGSDTITLQSADGNITLATSGGGDVILDPTSGIIALKGTTTLYAGNKILSSDGAAIQIGNDLGITGSLVTTGNINGLNLTTFSSSVATQILTIQTKTGSFATTGSNSFIGNQNISGTVYLTGSLIPSGNFVYDLGSATNSFRDLFISTGSIRFHNPDGTEQGRITVDARSGDISLLKTIGLTNEQKATISQGNINPDFLSAISASNLFVQTKIVMPAGGTVNGINLTAFSSSVSNTILNQNSATSSYETKGSGIVSGSSQITPLLPTGTISGSSQITYTSISSIPGGIVSGSSQVTTLLPTGTISGSSQLNNASIENLTVINLTTVNETASVIFSSGSNRFGDFGNDIHDFTGSVKISGSFTLVGSSTATSYNGTINATNGVVSGSSQITYANISSIPGGIVSGSSQTIINLPTGTVSGSSQVVSILSSVNTYTGSNDTLNSLQTTKIDQLAAGTASVNSFTASNGNTSLNSYTASNDTTNTAQSARLTTIESVTGSYETKGRSIVSGSSQITYTGISSIPGGIVSGSSQITLSSTTGYGSVLNQAVLTTSSPTFAGVTMNGSIGKTHDLMSEGTFGYSATYKTLKLGSTSASNPQSIAFGVDLSGNAGSSFSGYGTEYYFRNVGSFKTPNAANNEYNTLFGWNSSGQITFNQNATFSGTITGNASTATSAATLTTARTINGTSFDGSANITIPNLVSGSAQVTLSSTTGYGSVLNQAVLTTSSPTFAGTTINGHIYATNGSISFGGTSSPPTTDPAIYRVAGNDLVIAIASSERVRVASTGLVTTTAGLTVGGTITENSSLRYKENIEPIKYGLDKVLQMRGVTYNKKDNGVKEIGVIAEEIYEVLPEVVLKNEEGEIDSVSYGRITAVLIEAIKDLKKEIEELKANR